MATPQDVFVVTGSSELIGSGVVERLAAIPYRRLRSGGAAAPAHILINQDGIIRNIVLAELIQEAIVAHAQTVLPNGKEE